MARSISVLKITMILAGFGAAFAAAGIASVLCAEFIGTEHIFPGYVFLLSMFDLDAEGNLPTWYQSMLLFGCSSLLFTIARSRRSGERFYWFFLSGIFLIMSMDEICEFHNKMAILLPADFAASGFLHFQWVVFGTGLVVVGGIFFARFLFALPRTTSLLFIAAGALYVGGALVMEILEGPIADASGYEGLVFRLMAAAEECLEMAGLTVFVYALLRYIAVHVGVLRITLDAPRALPESVPAGLKIAAE